MSDFELELNETVPTVQYGNIHIVARGNNEEEVAERFFKLKKAFSLKHKEQPPFYSE